MCCSCVANVLLMRQVGDEMTLAAGKSVRVYVAAVPGPESITATVLLMCC